MSSHSVVIGLPFYDTVSGLWAVNMFSNLKPPIQTVIVDWTRPLWDARNIIIDKFLKTEGATHLLFWDTDIVVHPAALEKLLSQDKDVVSGLYFSRGYPHYPLARKLKDGKYYSLTNWKRGQTIEVDAAGLGLCLIKRGVLENLDKPYCGMPNEDIQLFENMKRHGYKVFVDTSVECGHVGSYVYTIDDYLQTKTKV